ncbi:hypothetical protein CYMTET_49444 [Cymbomonas tetramitiformis]|uniref:Uncharacterized protein n=1 Tax=Cymbomonas tetramitiformis TaxID=36881 RepID=A0AAE0BRH8_9CHLO|nr:hypothetical protein CYMTET_49444 [Cymbomonas tetramitiformis]
METSPSSRPEERKPTGKSKDSVAPPELRECDMTSADAAPDPQALKVWYKNEQQQIRDEYVKAANALRQQYDQHLQTLQKVYAQGRAMLAQNPAAGAEVLVPAMTAAALQARQHQQLPAPGVPPSKRGVGRGLLAAGARTRPCVRERSPLSRAPSGPAAPRKGSAEEVGASGAPPEAPLHRMMSPPPPPFPASTSASTPPPRAKSPLPLPALRLLAQELLPSTRKGSLPRPDSWEDIGRALNITPQVAPKGRGSEPLATSHKEAAEQREDMQVEVGEFGETLPPQCLSTRKEDGAGAPGAPQRDAVEQEEEEEEEVFAQDGDKVSLENAHCDSALVEDKPRDQEPRAQGVSNEDEEEVFAQDGEEVTLDNAHSEMSPVPVGFRRGDSMEMSDAPSSESASTTGSQRRRRRSTIGEDAFAEALAMEEASAVESAGQPVKKLKISSPTEEGSETETPKLFGRMKPIKEKPANDTAVEKALDIATTSRLPPRGRPASARAKKLTRVDSLKMWLEDEKNGSEERQAGTGPESELRA